jgi:hypothetical protein
MVSAASCIFTLPDRVASSMNGNSSGHCGGSCDIRLMPSWPIASQTFFRMARLLSTWMHSSNCALSIVATGGLSSWISEPPGED